MHVCAHMDGWMDQALSRPEKTEEPNDSGIEHAGSESNTVPADSSGGPEVCVCVFVQVVHSIEAKVRACACACARVGLHDLRCKPMVHGVEVVLKLLVACIRPARGATDRSNTLASRNLVKHTVAKQAPGTQSNTHDLLDHDPEQLTGQAQAHRHSPTT